MKLNIDIIRTCDSSEKLFFMAFCHFFVLRMAGIRNAAMKIASPISSIDGVMNIGRGLFKVFVFVDSTF